MTEYFIGIMSGTSLDGADAVVMGFEPDHAFTVVAQHSLPYPDELRQEILDLQSVGGDELRRTAQLGNCLAEIYARVVEGVLHAARLSARDIRAIGCHGQTIRHAPQDGYTLQIGNMALLAERCGIDVIGDFRSRDVAAGGQGAPLVPAFHQAAFAHPLHGRVIVNIGGISNLSLLLPGQAVSGFDCGPGNMLMDAWCQLHQGQPFDRDGAWARAGKVQTDLLHACLSEAFFDAAPPKSTGRDLFDLAWLQHKLSTLPPLSPVDVQATLLALTVEGIARAIERFAAQAHEVYLCGGGACNSELVRALRARLPGCSVQDCLTLGLPAQLVEAMAFAWLARQTVTRQPGNLPAVTGARGLRVLGAIYPR